MGNYHDLNGHLVCHYFVVQLLIDISNYILHKVNWAKLLIKILHLSFLNVWLIKIVIIQWETKHWEFYLFIQRATVFWSQWKFFYSSQWLLHRSCKMQVEQFQPLLIVFMYKMISNGYEYLLFLFSTTNAAHQLWQKDMGKSCSY